jgi:hypothetical protein
MSVAIVEFAIGQREYPLIGLVPGKEHKVYGPYESETHAEVALRQLGAEPTWFGTTISGHSDEHTGDYEGWATPDLPRGPARRYFAILPITVAPCLVSAQ